MTDLRYVTTDIEGARRLSNMIGRPDDLPDLSTDVVDMTRPIIAKIRSTIASGDYSQKDAMLMAINGSSLVETGQLVKVRHVGEGSVAANTIVIPEPCGRLGLCFVRQSAGTPIVTTPVNRYQRVVGPITDALGVADTVWQIGQQQFLRNNSIAVGSYGYYINHDWFSTPTRYEGLVPVWDKYLEPIRFEVHSHSDGYWSGSGNDLNQTVALPSPLNQLMFGPADVGISKKTLGSASHLSPMTISEIAPHMGGFIMYTSRNGGWLEYYTAYVTHARIWIDGVDQTGIYTVGQTVVSDGPNGNRVYTGDRMVAKVITAAVHDFKSVWFDFWVKLEIRTGTGSPGGNPQVFWVNSNGNFQPATFHYSDPNANRAATDDYEFTLSTAGPGSATTITTAAGQANWARIQSAFSYRMTWAGGGASSLGGFILFDWGRETPWIQLAWNARIGSPFGANGLALYFPEDSTDYEAIVFANGFQYKRGIWNPNGVTTFVLGAVRVQGVWMFRNSQRTGSLESFFTSWPATIDVEKL